jgi:murein DD-endopeptidase MepM/ murein hydrolase activator NlpD
MKLRAAILGLAAVLAPLGIAATPAPSPSPSAPAASAAATAQAKLVQDVRTELGSGLATALTAALQLSQTLQANGQQQGVARQALQAAAVRIAELDRSIAARQAQIDTTRARVATEQAELAALARALYRQPGSLLERMAGAGSLQAALTAAADLEAAGRQGGALEAALQHDLDALQTAQDQERAERQQEAALEAGQQRLAAGLATLAQQEQQTGATLDTAIQQLRSELAATGVNTSDVTKRISDELLAVAVQSSAAAEQEAWTQAELGLQANPAALALATSGSTARSPLIWPLPHAAITQPFGPTDFALEPPFAGYPHFHTGIDLAAPAGTPVLAAAAGIVVAVVSGTTGYGNYVVIAHAAGLTTLYGHLETALVTAGQTVAQGQPIGLEGSTGNSTGPHCHFEVRVDGQPVDPTPFLPPGGP